MRKLILLVIIVFALFSCCQTETEKQVKSDGFSFVFVTDIHITPERNATEGFLQAIDTINKISPDFVLSGGDNIMDALGQSYEASDSLYNLYFETAKNLTMPVYTTMGNHEVFGLYEKSGISPEHKLYGKKMYEDRLAQRYYSFDHKGWHFVIIDGIGFTEDRHYYGHVDAEQIEWLKKDLDEADNRPIIVSTHIPLLSVGSQIMQGPTVGMSEGSVITNANEVRKILEQHNTKLVLQGHLHFLEDVQYNGIHYITGGAVSAQWWQGPRFGMEEGFVEINVQADDFNWKYIDFGWEAQAK